MLCKKQRRIHTHEFRKWEMDSNMEHEHEHEALKRLHMKSIKTYNIKTSIPLPSTKRNLQNKVSQKKRGISTVLHSTSLTPLFRET